MGTRLMKNSPSFQLRRATSKDVDVTYKWQIHPAVRRYSRIKTPPSIIEHKDWFTKSLNCRYREIWVFECDSKPVGQLRLDKGDKNEVSILISPDSTGKGYGQAALNLICEYYNEIDLWAYVKTENVASIKLFSNKKFLHQYGNWYMLRSIKT